jgi:protein-L-isoaspartate(D-aspartate) O-methyltransferase
MSRKEKIIDYFNSLDRSLFMDINKDLAVVDTALPIGYGQTISQPSLVLEMTVLLNPEEDSKILEIGTGSGYQTALLSTFSGTVFTVERIHELYDKTKIRLENMGFDNVYFKLDDGTMGWEQFAPFDRIMVTAAARFIPPSLLEQLAPRGIMVIPVGGSNYQELLVIKKDSEGKVSTECKGYVKFVPLIGRYE